jgi:hypothetical protein
VSEDPSRAAWLRQARSHLRQADPVLARLIDDRPDFDPRARLAQLPLMDLYGALLFQITGQQLSASAGHPVVRWYEPGEDWYWCHVERLVFELESAPAAPSHS